MEEDKYGDKYRKKTFHRGIVFTNILKIWNIPKKERVLKRTRSLQIKTNLLHRLFKHL